MTYNIYLIKIKKHSRERETFSISFFTTIILLCIKESHMAIRISEYITV